LYRRRATAQEEFTTFPLPKQGARRGRRIEFVGRLRQPPLPIVTWVSVIYTDKEK
jgi:hypothetical protein